MFIYSAVLLYVTVCLCKIVIEKWRLGETMETLNVPLAKHPLFSLG